ncbi:MAG: type II secretion system protein [Candidatus Omnitrophota bacterium]
MGGNAKIESLAGKKTPRLRAERGFTFAELLAAMVFAAIVIPAAIQGLTIANRAGVAAERTRIAVQLAGSLLNEMIVTEEWRSSKQKGDFGADWPEYRWVLVDEEWTVDAMRVVSITVFFLVQDREYYVRLSALAEEEEEEA